MYYRLVVSSTRSWLLIEPAFDKPSEREATLAWCRELLDMYRAWGRNRHMQLTEMAADFLDGDSSLPVLLVSGFGASRVLERERCAAPETRQRRGCY